MDTEQIKVNIKRFFSNPNTLTFILVIGLIIVTYFIYNSLVNRAVSPVTLPFSTAMLTEEQAITSDVIGTVKLSGTFVTSSGEGLIQNRGQLTDKYVKTGYQIPKNSFFYDDAITIEKNTNLTPNYNMPDGYVLFSLPVNFHTTYGCSIMPGNYIDLYFSAMSDDGKKAIFEEFIRSIRVEKVLDKEGNNVFTHTEEGKQPAPTQLLFAVPEEYGKLLKTATLIRTNNIEIIPVPRNAGYSENPGQTEIANEAVEAFIRTKEVYVSE